MHKDVFQIIYLPDALTCLSNQQVEITQDQRDWQVSLAILQKPF